MQLGPGTGKRNTPFLDGRHMADQLLHFLSPADVKVLKRWIHEQAHANRPPGGSDGGSDVLYYTPDVYLAKFPTGKTRIAPGGSIECELYGLDLYIVDAPNRNVAPLLNAGDGSNVKVWVHNPYTATFMPQGYFPVHRLASGGYVCDRPSGLRKAITMDAAVSDVPGTVKIFNGVTVAFELEDVVSQMGTVEPNTMCTVGMVDGVDSIVTAKCDPEWTDEEEPIEYENDDDYDESDTGDDTPEVP